MSMKILFITQKVDMEDDVLGIYHEWIKSLAKKVQKVNAICLFRGKYQMPDNVAVFSLGKEKRVSNFRYILNFYKYIFHLRKDYDVVFVHMNPIYIILGWLPWKLLGKKIVYWNASYKINWIMKLGLFLCDQAVTSVRDAFDVKSSKIKAIGQGIDTARFQRDGTISKQPQTVLSLGRISPVKNLEVLIDAMHILYAQKNYAKLDIVGASASRKDEEYIRFLKDKSGDLENRGIINFLGRIPNLLTPKIYNSHCLFVNLTESKSFDKSILEAMACETLVLVSNTVYKEVFDNELADLLMFKEGDADDLAKRVEFLLALPKEKTNEITQKLRKIVVEKHSLEQLTSKLVNIFLAYENYRNISA